MRIRSILNKLIVIGLISITICFFLIMRLFSDASSTKVSSRSLHSTLSQPKLAVIVPYRDRFTELLLFVPHLSRFLHKQNIPFTINVINQNDSYRFNRASLINAGYSLVKDNCDYIAIHDVDLLPLNPNLEYRYPEHGPFHVSSPNLHPKYHYEKFVGGILLIKNDHFELVNGLSNKYWGWGLEDDEFYLRLKEANLQITRPTNIATGIEDTFLHLHDPAVRKRDYAKIFNQREITRKRDRETGLHDVKFELTSKTKMTIEDFACDIYSVKLNCDYKLTPWCDFSLVNKNKPKNVKPKI
ncbi:beta-1,4-galactosyltransferase 7-like [Tetranychus urticae]|uniref:Beta-1,4-galactosyltransferase 7 n=1 Tax=Tetranychus urticae TaxID=32264 RepID=T1KB34_TETUR|nr:beta-1,4-galactosyltransferase 7-like [Tetranychus urticae]